MDVTDEKQRYVIYKYQKRVKINLNPDIQERIRNTITYHRELAATLVAQTLNKHLANLNLTFIIRYKPC